MANIIHTKDGKPLILMYHKGVSYFKDTMSAPLLPNEYLECEYLESNGMLWINTNIVGGNIIEILANVSFSYNSNLINGVSQGSQSISFGINNNLIYFRIGNIDHSYSIPYDSNLHTFLFTNLKCYIDNTIKGTISDISSISRTLYLFANNYDMPQSHCLQRLFNVIIITNDGTKLLLIPCYRKSDRKPGMYDIINNKFLINENSTGDFITGPKKTTMTKIPNNEGIIGVFNKGRIVRKIKEKTLLTTILITQNDNLNNCSQIIKLIDSKDAINWIRNNSNLYVVLDGSTSNNIIIKQLSKDSKKLYADGNDASEDIKTKDVFMKLPRFWWTCSETYEDSNIWNIVFSTTELKDWFEWEDDTFIGVYKAHNDDNGVPYSVSGASMTVSVSKNAFKAGCATKGENYHLVTYEAHQIMCLLFYAYYLNTNAQAVCGSGFNSGYITGAADEMGMQDTPATGKAFVNFWGLEQWWGGKWEWIDNVITLGSGKVGIKEPGAPSNTSDIKRTVQAISGGGKNIKSLVMGAYGDVMPATVDDANNYNTYFADYGDVYGGARSAAQRSGYDSTATVGVACFGTSYGPGYADAKIGSRLLYKGNYSIIK